MTEKHFEQFKMADKFKMYEIFTKNILQVEPKILRAFNTVQFKDYSNYESSIFNPEEKFAYKEKFFDELLAQAFQIGKDLVAE